MVILTNIDSINTKIVKAILLVNQLKRSVNLQATDIRPTIKSVLHTGAASGSQQTVSYRDVTINHNFFLNKLIIKANTIEDLKNKISLSELKVNVTLFKKVNTNT